MKPSTYRCISHEKLTSTGTSDTKTATVQRGTSAVLVTVETNAARITLEGTDPAGGTGHVIPKDTSPYFLPVGPATILKAVSMTGTSVIQLSYIQ